MLNGYPSPDFIQISLAEIVLWIFNFAPGENPEFSRSDSRSGLTDNNRFFPFLSIIIDNFIFFFQQVFEENPAIIFFTLVLKLFFVKIHTRKNVLVNYCYTYESPKDCILVKNLPLQFGDRQNSFEKRNVKKKSSSLNSVGAPDLIQTFNQRSGFQKIRSDMIWISKNPLL